MELIYTQGKQNNYISNFFQSFLKYKINNIRKPEYVTNQFENTFKLGNKLKVLHEQYNLRIKAAKTHHQLTFQEFCQNAREVWDPFFDIAKLDIVDYVNSLVPKADYFADNLYRYSKDMKNSKINAFRLTNLTRFMFFIGSPFEISSFNDIRGDSIISHSNFNTCLKEFFIKYREKNKIMRIKSSDFLKEIKFEDGLNDEGNDNEEYESSEYDNDDVYNDSNNNDENNSNNVSVSFSSNNK